MAKIGRKEPCPCGSGKKFKRCCGLVSSVSAGARVFAPERDLAEALDAALEDCTASPPPAPPDYMRFKRWVHEKMAEQGPPNPYAFDPSGQWEAATLHGLIWKRIEELKSRLSQSQEKEGVTDAEFDRHHWNLFAKLKLLLSLLDVSDERTRDVLSATLSYNASANSDPDLEALTPAELRQHLFLAISRGADRLAFKILGRLNRGDHDVGELSYLEAWCY